MNNTHKDLFECVLDEGEEVIVTYKPVRKVIRNDFFFWFLVIPLLWPVLIFYWPIAFPIYRAWYNKRVYACTDRRIIVRGGIVGVDYKFLDYKDIKASMVKVGIMDKISKTNTGTLEFGSVAAPLGATNASGTRVNPFIFWHIENPHDDHKMIKKLIADALTCTTKTAE